MKLRGSGDISRKLLDGGWSLVGGWSSSSGLLWRQPYEYAPDIAARQYYSYHTRATPPSRGPGVTVVIPCLNECATIAEAVTQARMAFAHWPEAVEVIVADNGSTDGSAGLARTMGARVVSVPERGYGVALQAGFAAARAADIVYADADLTYNFQEGPRLIAALHNANADMVVGTRLRGQIEPGAMPILHRRLGTPVLTVMINLCFGGCLSDCNSGFRAFRRDRLAAWQASAPGMEFASELLVNALRGGAKIVEVPITLRCQRNNRRPHLQTWRDGMRHFLTILARAPWMFLHGGLAIVALSVLVALLCAFGPRLVFGRLAVFDYHTLIFAILLGFLNQSTRDSYTYAAAWHNASAASASMAVVTAGS